MPTALPKLETVDFSTALRLAELPPALTSAIEGCGKAPEAIEILIGQGHLQDASRLIAHALPKRESVWWACMCARHTHPTDLPPLDLSALEAAEAWVRKPSDENRRAAFSIAQQAGFGTPETWACVAAFWSGDSMAPLGQPVVPPAANLAGMAVAGSVGLAAVRVTPARQMIRLQNFIKSAMDIAAGGPGRLNHESEGAI